MKWSKKKIFQGFTVVFSAGFLMSSSALCRGCQGLLWVQRLHLSLSTPLPSHHLPHPQFCFSSFLLTGLPRLYSVDFAPGSFPLICSLCWWCLWEVDPVFSLASPQNAAFGTIYYILLHHTPSHPIFRTCPPMIILSTYPIGKKEEKR